MIRQIWFQNRQNNEKNRPQTTKEVQNVVFNLKGRILLLFYLDSFIVLNIVRDNLKLI
jgi:hypothetical protein